ncbi:MAG: hypothetical protein ACR2H1_01795, partial [Limisphaerales bacterium]
MSQDIIFQEQLVSPADYNLDPDTTEIEVWTEFLNPPEPTKQSNEDKVTKQENISVLDFGDMRIGPGNAFMGSAGVPPAGVGVLPNLGQGGKSNISLPHATPVNKKWITLEGRTFLIESIGYKSILSQLEKLPARLQAQNLKSKTKNSQLARGRIAPPMLEAQTEISEKLKVAVLDHKEQGFVLDYELSGSMTDFTFQGGDTTYYVTDTLILDGVTTIEGGAVVKFATYTPDLYIQFNGSVNCLTTPYRPAIFTAVDDDSVGELIDGSTGYPGDYYASTALYSPGFTTGDLHNITVKYAMYAFQWWFEASQFRDLQVINCGIAFIRTYTAAPMYNILVNNAVYAFYGYSVTYDLQHVTVNGCGELTTISGYYSQGTLLMTNCVLANVASIGTYNTLAAGHNGFYNSPQVGNNQTVSTASPFQSIGSGSHYLTSASGFRNVGISEINSSLLNSLQGKTTYPPASYSDQTIS